MVDEQLKQIKSNLERVEERISLAARRVGRDEAEIQLVAVTKQKSAVVIKALLESGVHQIGESYLKEALFKMDLLGQYDITWHMIGNIQSGKEKQIAQGFQVIHSVGTLQTAMELNKYAGKGGLRLPVYLEMNVSGEDTKGGWLADKSSLWEGLLPDLEHLADLPALSVMGLMTMAPYSLDPEDARPYFVRLRELRKFLAANCQNLDDLGLSMGMSGDFEVAVEEGATTVRIGSALVGPRE